MSEVPRLEELIAAYLSLLDNVATFLLTFALVYAIGRFALRPLVSAALRYRNTERTLQQGLEREGIDLGATAQSLENSIGAGSVARSGADDTDDGGGL